MTETRKAIFITGGGSGIGRAIATAYAEHGARVILADLAAPDLTSLDRARALALDALLDRLLGNHRIDGKVLAYIP